MSIKRLVLLELDLGRHEQEAKSYLITTNYEEELLEEKVAGIREWIETDDHDEIIDVLADRDFIQVLNIERYNIG